MMDSFFSVLFFLSAPPIRVLAPLVRGIQGALGRNNYWLAFRLFCACVALDLIVQYDDELKLWYFGLPDAFEVIGNLCVVLGFALPLHRASLKLEAQRVENLFCLPFSTQLSLFLLLALIWPLTLLSFFLSGENIVHQVAFSVDLSPVLPELCNLFAQFLMTFGSVAAVLPPQRPRRSKLIEWMKDKLAAVQYQVSLSTVRRR